MEGFASLLFIVLAATACSFTGGDQETMLRVVLERGELREAK